MAKYRKKLDEIGRLSHSHEALVAALKAWDAYGGFDTWGDTSRKANAMAEAIRSTLAQPSSRPTNEDKTMTISREYAEELGRQIDELEAENERLRDFSTWVDTWVSNPVTSYSVYALDGLFGTARDKLAALRRS